MSLSLSASISPERMPVVIFKAPVVKSVPKPKVTTPVEKKPVDTGRTLVGKMPSADGGVILYYRTADGKIEYEKE